MERRFEKQGVKITLLTGEGKSGLVRIIIKEFPKTEGLRNWNSNWNSTALRLDYFNKQ